MREGIFRNCIVEIAERIIRFAEGTLGEGVRTVCQIETSRIESYQS